jgi:hypothetical protein
MVKLFLIKKKGRRRGRAMETNSLPSGDTPDVPPMMSTQAPGIKLTNRQEGTRERPATSTRGLTRIRIVNAVVCCDPGPKYRRRGH